ncbi:hypothetical protein [Alienimonas chondri]|uniref:Uncharacterized protein n=1 Tax=Alienimonas chondri TaxID=2681879 RepID=A0ABX1VBM5_9PLAN|nr:hypothetical protein [Alienimonas chondri]NNJ25512.1 hypothetical protein [Alienimonas chondri]
MEALLIIVLLAAAGAWLYGEAAGLRWLRIPAVLTLIAGAAWTGGIAGYWHQWFTLGQEYAVRLQPFREAAETRLEAGESDRVLAELRFLDGRLTYENPLTWRSLEESTARLNEPAAETQGADAPRSPE